MRSFFRNITLLNIILIATIAIVSMYIISPSFNLNVKYTLPAARKIVDGYTETSSDTEMPSSSDYIIIAEENLFHPERRIPPEKKVEQELPKPDFVLFGTMITDEISLAYMEDAKAPRSTPGRGKRQIALKKGDMISSFTLKEIETDKVVMVRGEEKIIIPVHDPQRPKSRAETMQTQPATTAASVAPTRFDKKQASKQLLGESSKPATPTQPVRDKDQKVFDALDRMRSTR